MSVGSLNLSDLFRTDFRTSREADDLNTQLQAKLQFDYRYQVARLAIGLSLNLANNPSAVADALGKPIRGETLFGQDEADLALWVALIVERHPEAAESRKKFLELTANHWARGLRELSKRLSKNDGSILAFLSTLATKGESAVAQPPV